MSKNSSCAERVALITGITGQDGSYLAEFLLEKGYRVYGLMRRSSSFNTGRIDHLYQDPHDPDPRLQLVYGDLNDASSLNKILRSIQPDEIYNLGAQSHVRVSFDIPEYTAEITGVGTLRLLEAIRDSGICPKFYQASSSEMFGKVQTVPQNEKTPFYPRSPYGAAKVYSYWITVNYREAYNMFACNGILFNHESPRRGETFVTRKITKAAARIKLGIQNELFLGNLDARRDWGFAGDYVEAMLKCSCRVSNARCARRRVDRRACQHGFLSPLGIPPARHDPLHEGHQRSGQWEIGGLFVQGRGHEQIGAP